MLNLPVSLGEAIDKLTILDIKCRKIKDSSDSMREYTLLNEQLRDYVVKYHYQYTVLRKVNEEIWNMQDTLRAMAHPKGDLCIDILNKNDMRFRIKDNINKISGSYIREQKGYPEKRALFISHLGLGDHIGMNGAVRYLALHYEEIVVPVSESNYSNVAAMFSDNPAIKLLPVKQSYVVYPTEKAQGELIHFNPNHYSHVYRSGFYTCPRNDMSELPHSFYRDLNIDPRIRHDYFNVPRRASSSELYKPLESMKYIFTQQKASNMFTSLVTWDKDEFLTIDPNVNVYTPEHKWYELAQTFVDKPFFDYIEVIENAEEIHTLDSSFYCISCYLTLKASVKRCYNRETGVLIPTYTFN